VVPRKDSKKLAQEKLHMKEQEDDICWNPNQAKEPEDLLLNHNLPQVIQKKHKECWAYAN
jgi:hypothetical protein